MGVRLQARPVFLEREDHSILVDFLAGGNPGTAGGGTGAPDVLPGLPFSLRLGAPPSGWALPAVAVLERWAEAGATVDLELKETPSGARVVLSDHDTMMRFDLELPFLAG